MKLLSVDDGRLDLAAASGSADHAKTEHHKAPGRGLGHRTCRTSKGNAVDHRIVLTVTAGRANPFEELDRRQSGCRREREGLQRKRLLEHACPINSLRVSVSEDVVEIKLQDRCAGLIFGAEAEF